jgi:hypothetical protein
VVKAAKSRKRGKKAWKTVRLGQPGLLVLEGSGRRQLVRTCLEGKSGIHFEVKMKLTSHESPSSLTIRLFALLRAAWMALVLLTFLAIRVIGSHSFQFLHVFGKTH